jgi:hypothetical protein
MTRVLIVLLGIAALATSVAGAQNARFPSRIDLPDGFQPEGIATAGERFFVGSIPTGAVYRGSLRTGQGAVFVPAQAGRAAIGMKVDRGRLFVAGGPLATGSSTARATLPCFERTRSRPAGASSTTSSSRSGRRGSRTRRSRCSIESD